MSINNDLKSAIEARNVICFLDKNDRHRELETHHYGKRIMNVGHKFLKNSPEDAVFGFQVDGYSKSNSKKNKPLDFREFELSEIKDFKINKEEFFEVRANYKLEDRRWKIDYSVTDSPGNKFN